MTTRAKSTAAEAISGCMYAAAIGDALGSAFEFVDALTIERELGEPFVWTYHSALRGSLLFPRKPGNPTDDTAMALSVAHLVAQGDRLEASDFSRAFLSDLDRENGRFADMFWHGGPGGATVRALSRLSAGSPPATCGDLNDGGNGAAMRAHPIGFLADRAAVLAVAALQAQVTHGHPAAIAAAQAVAVLVHDAISGLEPTLDAPAGITEPEFLDAWNRAHAAIRGADRLPKHLIEVEMSGWDTVAAAHAISYVFQDDPRRAIAAAAASGRDTDTVASIVGAIVGARYGLGCLDPIWIEHLQAAPLVDLAIQDLLNTRSPHTRR